MVFLMVIIMREWSTFLYICSLNQSIKFNKLIQFIFSNFMCTFFSIHSYQCAQYKWWDLIQQHTLSYINYKIDNMRAEYQGQSYDIRDHFIYQLSLNNNQKSRVEKVLVDREFKALKIIKCTSEHEMFLRSILYERQCSIRKIFNLSAFQTQIIYQTVIDEIEGKSQIFLFVLSPYKPSTKLTDYTNMAVVQHLANKPEISYVNKTERVNRIIFQVIIALLNLSNFQLYTFSCFLFDRQLEEVTVNTTSFVGLDLLMNDMEIPKDDFFEIYELLGTQTLTKKGKQRFTNQLKFRSIGIILLSLIFGKRFSVYFDKTKWDDENKPGQKQYLKKYNSYLQESKKKFETLFNIQKITSHIKEIQEKLDVKYLKFLKQLFVKEKQMTWSQVVEMLIPKAVENPNIPNNSNLISTLQIAKHLYKTMKKKQPMMFSQQKQYDTSERFFNIFLIAMISDQNTNVEQLLQYQNLDDFFYNPKQNLNRFNSQILKKMIKIVQFLAHSYQYQLTENYKESERYQTLTQNVINSDDAISIEKNTQGQPDPVVSRYISFIEMLSSHIGVYKGKIKHQHTLTCIDTVTTLKKYKKLLQ